MSLSDDLHLAADSVEAVDSGRWPIFVGRLRDAARLLDNALDFIAEEAADHDAGGYWREITDPTLLDLFTRAGRHDLITDLDLHKDTPDA